MFDKNRRRRFFFSINAITKRTFRFTAFGPEDWDQVAGECGRCSQSPIDILTNKLVDPKFEDKLKVDFVQGNSLVSGMFKNNGHSPTLSITSWNTATLSGGPLGSEYKLQQLHFHFGCISSEGSEHLVDHKAYPAEMRFRSYFEGRYACLRGLTTSNSTATAPLPPLPATVQCWSS